MISFAILAAVFILIAIRQVGSFKLQIWQIMLGGASAVLLTGRLSPAEAFSAVNFDVIFFLLGMFIVGEAMDRSGYLSGLAYNFLKHTKSAGSLIAFILIGMGIISVIFMNDTVAIIGTPIVLMAAKKNNLPPKLLLLALAFAVTTGSVMSPIGNPQNLLIALNGGLKNPFLSFSKYLFIPTAVNLAAAYFLLKMMFKNQFGRSISFLSPGPPADGRLAFLSKISVVIILICIAVKMTLMYLKLPIDFKLTYIALAAALPIVLFDRNRIKIIRHVDWHTLIFFAAMFIVMQSVWNAGVFQNALKDAHLNITSVFTILTISILLSQLISNVPLVALYMPLLLHAGISTEGMMALAAGSTVAGNMLILGAASNIIIIQNAEKRSGDTLTFWDFARAGIPLTVINFAVYFLFLKLF